MNNYLLSIEQVPKTPNFTANKGNVRPRKCGLLVIGLTLNKNPNYEDQIHEYDILNGSRETYILGCEPSHSLADIDWGNILM